MKHGNSVVAIALEPWTVARLNRIVEARRSAITAIDRTAKVSRHAVLREMLEREIAKAEITLPETKR